MTPAHRQRWADSGLCAQVIDFRPADFCFQSLVKSRKRKKILREVARHVGDRLTDWIGARRRETDDDRHERMEVKFPVCWRHGEPRWRIRNNKGDARNNRHLWHEITRTVNPRGTEPPPPCMHIFAHGRSPPVNVCAQASKLQLVRICAQECDPVSSRALLTKTGLAALSRLPLECEDQQKCVLAVREHTHTHTHAHLTVACCFPSTLFRVYYYFLTLPFTLLCQ